MTHAGPQRSVQYRYSRVTREVLELAAGRFIDLESRRRIPRQRINETWIQGFILGLLEDRIGYMELEYSVDGGRVDYYHKGNPPSAIELAIVKDRNYSPWEHLPEKNRTEIAKLRGLEYPKKLRRFLLLIDLVREEPFERNELKKRYTDYFGNTGRSMVTVIYVHKDGKFTFAF